MYQAMDTLFNTVSENGVEGSRYAYMLNMDNHVLPLYIYTYVQHIQLRDNIMCIYNLQLIFFSIFKLQ